MKLVLFFFFSVAFGFYFQFSLFFSFFLSLLALFTNIGLCSNRLGRTFRALLQPSKNFSVFYRQKFPIPWNSVKQLKKKQNKTKRRIDGGLNRKPGKNIKEKRRKISRVVDLM